MNENEQTTSESEAKAPTFSRSSAFRPLWWILQGFIISVWKTLVTLVMIWQFFHILIRNERHDWSREFARKFVNHVRVWIEYITWVRDERPKIIEY